MKLGSGWKNVGGPVYEAPSGLRIHILGLCQLTNGELVNGMRWPESSRLNRYVLINGGNHKRGAMAWALSLVKESRDAE